MPVLAERTAGNRESCSGDAQSGDPVVQRGHPDRASTGRRRSQADRSTLKPRGDRNPRQRQPDAVPWRRSQRAATRSQPCISATGPGSAASNRPGPSPPAGAGPTRVLMLLRAIPAATPSSDAHPGSTSGQRKRPPRAPANTKGPKGRSLPAEAKPELEMKMNMEMDSQHHTLRSCPQRPTRSEAMSRPTAAAGPLVASGSGTRNSRAAAGVQGHNGSSRPNPPESADPAAASCRRRAAALRSARGCDQEQGRHPIRSWRPPADPHAGLHDGPPGGPRPATPARHGCGGSPRAGCRRSP